MEAIDTLASHVRDEVFESAAAAIANLELPLPIGILETQTSSLKTEMLKDFETKTVGYSHLDMVKAALVSLEVSPFHFPASLELI